MTLTETMNMDTENTFGENSKGQLIGQSRKAPAINVNQKERMASAVAGGALAVIGIARGGWCGLLMALTGGGLVYRGATGHCVRSLWLNPFQKRTLALLPLSLLPRSAFHAAQSFKRRLKG